MPTMRRPDCRVSGRCVMRWSDILIEKEKAKIGRTTCIEEIGPSGWGGYNGTPKYTIMENIEDGVKKACELSRKLLPGDTLGYNSDSDYVYIWINPSENRIVNMMGGSIEKSSFIDACVRLIIGCDFNPRKVRLSKEFEYTLDKIENYLSPSQAKLDDIAFTEIGQWVMSRIGVPDLPKIDWIISDVYKRIGFVSWHYLLKKLNLSGKFFGLTWIDGKPHSASIDECVVSERHCTYYVHGHHFLTIGPHYDEWHWICPSSRVRKWERVLEHASLHLVQGVMGS
jgi:hypothetical protein